MIASSQTNIDIAKIPMSLSFKISRKLSASLQDEEAVTLTLIFVASEKTRMEIADEPIAQSFVATAGAMN